MRIIPMAWRPTAAIIALVLFAGACRDTSPVASNDLSPAFASSSSLPHIYNTLAIPVNTSADLVAYECANNPGPQITLSGLVVMGGLDVNMLFSNNFKGTHTNDADVEASVTVLEPGDEIVIPKQPVLGGTGGNPFIWVQWINGDGSAASDEIFIGRCVQGAGWHVTGPSSTNVNAWADFAVTSCENSPGPYITVGSGMTANGLIARIIFRNNDNPVGGPHDADVTRDVVMVGPGSEYTFPKQPVQGGVGGNPWIFAGWGSGDVALSEETLLGRCEQISKLFS